MGTRCYVLRVTGCFYIIMMMLLCIITQTASYIRIYQGYNAQIRHTLHASTISNPLYISKHHPINSIHRHTHRHRHILPAALNHIHHIHETLSTQSPFYHINNKFKSIIHDIRANSLSYLRSKMMLNLMLFLSNFVLFYKKAVMASGSTASLPSNVAISPIQGLVMWTVMFILSAILHSAESAITKISPWKVQQFSDEEGPRSPFATLSNNITRLLSTIVLTTTACSIYSTALFVTSVAQLLPSLSLGTITAVLTVITILLGEVFPKALAVGNSELVARKMVPFVNTLAQILSPLTTTITFVSNGLLTIFGLRKEEDKNVSEDILRLVVEEAQRTEGIESGEGRMIKNVLDMQDKEVRNIMQPRVDVVAVPVDATAQHILEIAAVTKYSRIPIFRDDIDHIVGVVFAKDLLDLVYYPHLQTHNTSMLWNKVSALDIMEDTYFIPETMSTWIALQEMRKRHIHLAVVVDEYGGTAGLVTLEDILEEVVGEIYDEDDGEEQAYDSSAMFRREDGSYIILGSAALDDVCEALGLVIDENTLGEYSTIGGYLCAAAGEIPRVDDVLELLGYRFIVLEVEDNRRIVNLSVEKMPDVILDADGKPVVVQKIDNNRNGISSDTNVEEVEGNSSNRIYVINNEALSSNEDIHNRADILVNQRKTTSSSPIDSGTMLLTK